MLIRTPWKRVFLICVCGWHKIGWKETKHWSDVESTQQRSWFRRTNIFPWSCIPGMHWKTMWNKQRYCRQIQNHVWIQSFCRSNGKITMLGKSAYFFVVIWHGGSCQEKCGTILWVGKQNDSTTLQSINSMHRWPPLQRGRLEWRDEKSTDPKGWIQGSTKIGPVLEVTTSYLQGKHGVEIRIESVNKDNSHSWVRIFSWLEKVGHGLEQQRIRRQRAGDLWDEDGGICVCKPI